jgi:hypothetical protein
VKYLLVLICGVLSVSCIFDTEQCITQIPTHPVVLEGEHTISFTIGFDTSTTRVECDTTNYAVPFDYHIDPGTLRVMLTDTENNAIGEIERLYIWPTNEKQTEFEFTGKLPDGLVFDPAEPKYKLFALVNAPAEAIDREFTLYHHQRLDPRNEGSSIPMWGVMTVDLSPILSVPNYKIPNALWMLRSAAKIEVQLSQDLKDKGTEITSATMKYYNVEGYVAPADWHSFSDTHEVDCEEAINVYRHAAVNLPLIKDEATGDYYVYMPEYDNQHYPGERNKISLTMVHNGEEVVFEDVISFCDYSNGAIVENSDYNIVRNHIYRFTIRSIAGSSLVLEYKVADWTTEDWGDGQDYEEHDLSYPTYHNPVVPYEFLSLNGTEQTNYVISKQPTMHYNPGNWEEGGFHCYFQILAPNNVGWKPVFMGSKENYQIRVYHLNNKLEEGTEAIFDSAVAGKQGNIGECGAGEWYHIVIFPLSNDGADSTEIEFGISYYQAWTDQYINLYVNGEYGNIRWPNSGSNPKLINIRHTSQPQQAIDDEEE